MQGNKQEIIIIGAGAAGLQAAATLSEREDVSFRVLEASSYIGGRIRELNTFAEVPIQLGAEFVHSSKSINYRMLKEDGAEMEEMLTLGESCYTQCRSWDPEELCKQDEHIKSAMELFCGELIFDLELESDMTLKEWVEKTQTKRNGVHPAAFIYRAIAQIWGGSWEQFSMKGWQQVLKEMSSYSQDGSNSADSKASTQGVFDNFVLRPPVTQAQTLNKHFGHLTKHVELKRRVVRVDYSSDKINLEDDEGRKYQADGVIITVPLAILKKKRITFEPELPQEKVEAIDSLGMGAGGKIFIRFKKNLWGRRWSLLNDGFIVMYNSAAVFETIEKNRVLVGFILGSEAETFGKLSKEEQRKLLFEDMAGILGKAEVEENYEDHYYHGWELEEDIGGAYSYPSTDRADKHRQHLAKPLCDRVHFAGEATNTQGYVQTISGALDTGKIAAKALCDALHKP